MRRLIFGSLFLFSACLASACGGGGIKEGIPDNTDNPPPTLDPGGDVVPDMSGKPQPKPKR